VCELQVEASYLRAVLNLRVAAFGDDIRLEEKILEVKKATECPRRVTNGSAGEPFRNICSALAPQSDELRAGADQKSNLSPPAGAQ
jgi:hypothetical protein